MIRPKANIKIFQGNNPNPRLLVKVKINRKAKSMKKIKIVKRYSKVKKIKNQKIRLIIIRVIKIKNFRKWIEQRVRRVKNLIKSKNERSIVNFHNLIFN
jgi:hypothetical protein